MRTLSSLSPSLAAVIRSEAAAVAADPTSLPVLAGAYRLGDEVKVSGVDLGILHDWLAYEYANIPGRLAFVDRPVSLQESVACLVNPRLPGETRFVPVSTSWVESVPGLLTRNQALALTAVCIHAAARLQIPTQGEDVAWPGVLTITLGLLHTAPPQIWPILASLVAGSAAVELFEGTYPEPRVSRECLRAIALHEENPLHL